MAARPSGRDDEDPTTIEFGIAALDARLGDADVSFPATDEELVRALGDPEIEVDPHGRSISLSDALARVDGSRFESKRELLNALHPVFESSREGASRGILASIRTLLPF